ncbi:glycosyltransferase family 2 protein [Flavobacterium sp. MAHUQ-51]|uniref:glycosyltransferase family 2 protein n=1 Tax=Flavobacterium sp. GCM10022190 TaxID=3252639 RepID=UPI00360DBD57
MLNSPKVSIIIPVYNAELYLEKCIDSLLTQTLSVCEFIFVNDGSVDSSQSILESYQIQDSRIKLINQENQGVSVARNTGVLMAQGEYIGFVDADDYINPNYFERFLELAGSDLIAINSIVYNSKNELLINRTHLYQHMLASDSFNSVCFKIFKRDIIVKNGVTFPVGVRLGEDAHFIMDFLQYTTTVALISDYQGYFYRENQESATKSPVKDYSVFDRVFSEFKMDHQKQYNIPLTATEILDAKLQKLWKTYMAALSLYFRANTVLDKSQRNQFIEKSMIEFSTIYKQTAHNMFWHRTLSRFEEFVQAALIKQQFWKLKMAYTYSHFRNGIK